MASNKTETRKQARISAAVKVSDALQAVKQNAASLLEVHTARLKELDKDIYPDGTYNLDTFESVSYNSGYQVTFCQIGDNYTPQEYAEKVSEFLAVSSDGITSAGKFGGSPEISFHVNNKRVAIRLAKKYNQMSVWDWVAIDEIDTGGTGRR